MEMPFVFLPPWYDALWTVAAVATISLFVVGLVCWARTSFRGAGEQAMWLLLIFFVPVLGPAVFLIGRRLRATSVS